MHTDSYITLALEDAFMGIALGFVALRLYVRCWLQSRFDSADGFIVSAWFLFFGNCLLDRLSWGPAGLEIVWTAGVVGQTVPDFYAAFHGDVRLAHIALKLAYINFVPNLCILFFVKFAFLRLYYDLIPECMKRLRLALYWATGFTVFSFVVLLFLNMCYCWPISKNWEPVKDKSCYTVFEETPWFITAILHILTDLTIYALPFFLLPSLRASSRVNRTSLVGVIVMFSLGAICISITIARMIATGLNGDVPSVCLFQAAEYGAGIIVACCPPFKWLWMSLRQHGYKAKGVFSEVETATRATCTRRGSGNVGVRSSIMGDWRNSAPAVVDLDRRKRGTVDTIQENHDSRETRLTV